jgi:hypothetical protein
MDMLRFILRLLVIQLCDLRLHAADKPGKFPGQPQQKDRCFILPRYVHDSANWRLSQLISKDNPAKTTDKKHLTAPS